MKQGAMPQQSPKHLALFFSALVALVGCSAQTPRGGDALGLGEASVAVTLDADGCTAADIELESTTGRPLRLPQGCLDFRNGTVVRELTLRLGAQPATIVPLGQRGLQSSHRVELLAAGGQPVQAGFGSPFEITLDDPESLGTWFVTGYVDGNEWSQGEIDGAEEVALDAVAWNLDRQGTMLIRQTGAFGLTYEPLAAATPSLKGGGNVGGNGTVTQTAQLDGDDTTELAVFSLINQQTAQVVFGGIYDAPIDTTFVVTSPDGTLFASYESTGDGGTRLVLEGPFGNVWRLEAGQVRASDDFEVATETIMVGGSSEEASPNDLYAGFVKTELRILAPATFWLSAAADFALLFTPPETAVVRWLQQEGETTVGGVDILRLQASVPRILNRLPSDWFGAGGDRTMDVAAPAPVELNVSVSGDGDGTGNVSSTDPTFAIGCDVPPLTCTETFLVNDGGEIFLEATAASDSVFAGWSGCPEPLLDQCRLSWTEDEDVVSFDVTARFELTDDDPCHSAYSGNAGYLPCQGAGPGQCKFYTVLGEVRSCDDACQAGGGSCISALRDVADGCSGTEAAPCNDTANDRICFCTQP